jgi:hypothetical protein
MSRSDNLTEEDKLWHQRQQARLVATLTGEPYRDPLEPPRYVTFQEPRDQMQMVLAAWARETVAS